MEKVFDEALAHLEEKRDAAIGFACTQELGPKRPDLKDLAVRLRRVQYSSGWEVVELDGKPIVRFGPFKQNVKETPAGVTINIWRDVERVRPDEANDGGTAA